MVHARPAPPVWDDGRWDGLAPLTEDTAADVAVVGLGGSGLAAVGELLRQGAAVVGLDAGPVAGGAAGRNGGLLLAGLAPFHHRAVERLGRARATRAYRLTLAELARMAAETPGLISTTGSLRIAGDEEEAADIELHLAALGRDGLPGTGYAGPEGTGLLVPTDGTTNPLARARALARAAAGAGARLHERTAVRTIAAGLLTTSTGATVRAGAVLVLVDGPLDGLLPPLAGRVRPARLEMLATEPTAEVHLPRPVYARWGYDYWQQAADGQVALGGGRDHFLEASWTADAGVTAGIQAHLDHVLRDVIGVRQARVTHRWAATVGYTAGDLPLVEQLDGPLWVAGGYNGTGNVVGSLCGRGLAQLATRGDTDLLP